jgi:ATP-dependent Clp protease protease subunit
MTANGANGKSWFSMRKRAARGADEKPTGYVSIYGDIGGWGLTALDFKAALDSLGDVGTLRVNIASDGGDISAGYAVFNLLASHPARKVMTVDSLAASMASVIFMAGDERIMPKNAFLMIHNPWGAMMGSGDEFISFGQALLDMQDSIVESYVDATGRKPKEVRDMMDKETWLKASTAKKLGFATKVVEPRELNAKRGVSFERVSTFNRAPTAIRALTQKESNMTTKRKSRAADDEFENLDGDESQAKTPAEIRAEILEQHNEIRSLCKLAGLPKLADKFIADDADMKTVRAELEKAQAAAKKGKGKGKGADEGDDEDDDEDEELSARRAARAERGKVEIDTASVYAKFNKRR